jgi:hypothetical protein
MTKKRKIIDIIFFNGQVNILEFRLTELNPFVDTFIIIESLSNSSESMLVKHNDIFDTWKEKFIHLYAPVDFASDEKIELVHRTILKLKLYFEDIIMVSDVNEVPNLLQFDNIIEELKFDAVLLKPQKFVWNVNYIDKNRDNGSLIFFYTKLIQNKPNIKKYYSNKDLSNIVCEKIENGWKFVGFDLKDRVGFEYQIEEKLPMTEVNPLTTYQLIESDLTNLPVNYKLLPKNEIGRDFNKNHLFIVNQLSGTTIEELEGKYDTVSIFEFISDVDEQLGEKITDKITKHSIFVPNIVLYGDDNLEEFQKNYKLNEIERLKHTLFLKENDTITII